MCPAVIPPDSPHPICTFLVPGFSTFRGASSVKKMQWAAVVRIRKETVDGMGLAAILAQTHCSVPKKRNTQEGSAFYA